jgi:hypothetical protein
MVALPMAELELTRSSADRRLYTLDGVGTLRLKGWFARTATAEAGGRTWEFSRRGFFGKTFEAIDAAGPPVGSFEGGALRRGGVLRWDGCEFALRPSSAWRERYALALEDHELAVIEGKGWGRRPVKVEVADIGAVAPALLLFAAFIVRSLAEDAQAAAGAAASTAATG